MGLKNLGPKLTNIFKGSVNSIPEEFQSDMTITDQAVPNDVMPDETDVDLVASQVTTNQRNERRRKNTYLTLPAERDDRQLDGPQHSGSTFSAITKTIKTIATVPQTIDKGFLFLTSRLLDLGRGRSYKQSETLESSDKQELTLTNGGSGYTSAPTVGFTGGTPKAGVTPTAPTATAYLGFPVVSLTIDDQGHDYTYDPLLYIHGGNGGGAVAIARRGRSGVAVVMSDWGKGYTSAPTVAFTGGGGSGMAGTAQIAKGVGSSTVTAVGSGYTSPPDIVFSGGGGFGAAAIPILGFPIASIVVDRPGSNFASAPTVAFSGGGGGTGLAATAVLGKSIASVTVTAGGSGYTTADLQVLGDGEGAVVTAVLTSGAISSVTVVSPGSGYVSGSTTIAITGDGTGAVLTVNLASLGSVKSITITNAGTGYTSAPAVTFSGGGGTGARATAYIDTTAAAVVRSITITNPGGGYTSAPTITISGGGGSGATATTTLESKYHVTGVAMTSYGTGYTSSPTVTFTGGGGTGATGTVALSELGKIVEVILISGGQDFETAPTVDIIGGGGSGAVITAHLGVYGSVKKVVLTQIAVGYDVPPAVTFSGTGTGAAGMLLLEDKNWPSLQEVVTDPTDGIVVLVDKRIVPAGTIKPAGYVDLYALDTWRSVQITSKIDLLNLPRPQLSKSTFNFNLPDLLWNIYPIWDVAKSERTTVNTGYSSSNVSVTVTGEIVVERVGGFRGAAQALVFKQFFFGVPPDEIIPRATVIQPSSGTVIVTSHSQSTQNDQGSQGGVSSVTKASSNTTKTSVVDISNVLTGGLITSQTSDTSSVTTTPLTSDANALGIDTTWPNFSSATATANGTMVIHIPASNPRTAIPGSMVLVAATVEKWRFDLHLLLLTYVIVPNTAIPSDWPTVI
jgi:hypothetical protein